MRVNGKDIYLGPYNPKESRKEYDRLLAELDTGEPAAAVAARNDLTVAEVVKQYWLHATDT